MFVTVELQPIGDGLTKIITMFFEETTPSTNKGNFGITHTLEDKTLYNEESTLIYYEFLPKGRIKVSGLYDAQILKDIMINLGYEPSFDAWKEYNVISDFNKLGTKECLNPVEH